MQTYTHRLGETPEPLTLWQDDGIPDATLDRYEALARQHLVPILYNIRIQRTERARERVTIRAGEVAYERCRAQ